MHAAPRSVTRRGLLAGLGSALVAGGGCLAADAGGDGGPVSMLVAGSLYNAVENGLRPRSPVALRVEGHGSATVARLVAEDQKRPDIVSLADVDLFDGPLHPSWYATFATNSIVLAYDAADRRGARVGEATAWYRPLLEREVALGRTDPDLDPLGYRTLFVLALASEHYDLDVDLRSSIPRRDQVYPETQLVSQFETGSIDAAFVYRNMAVERGYAFVELPPAIDLSDPRFAEAYGTVSYDLPSGKTVRGSPIRYGATAPRPDGRVATAFDAHTTGGYLREFGFAVPETYPIYQGDVPDAIAS